MTRPTEHPVALAVSACLLLAASPALRAQQAAAPAAAAASAPARPQQVEVTGTTAPESSDERRRATASRITYGREELDRMGDASLGEVLKRLPGVTLGGPPGRGGQVRMRGMGGGYTQILIDGQRMAPGFSLDSIAPEQIEKIEIMRAPVAEFGTRAIAGTINVVMRSDFKRKANEFKLGGGADGSRPQLGASWATNGQADTLGYNLSATLFQGGRDDVTDIRTVARNAAGAIIRDQQVHSTTEGTRQGLFANARLQWRLGPGEGLDLQPFLNLVRTRGTSLALLDQPVGATVPYTRATGDSETTWQMARLNGTWTTGTGSGGRLLVRFGGRLSDADTRSSRQETGGSSGLARQRTDDSGNREVSVDMNGKFSQLIAERHSASAGWELERTTRDDRRSITINGQLQTAELDENLSAQVQRVALYAQDEWEWTKQFSFYVGARWEAIDTRSDALQNRAAVANRSAVFAPLAHMVWKFPDAPRDQLRLSLTRSYRSPNLNQLIARPTWSTEHENLGETNSASKPDRVGNPALKPELAWGLELGYEHYLDAGGVLSANVYLRRIDDLIRTVRSNAPVVVPWATVPRYLAQPQNVGSADAAGLELEAKARLVDLWPGAPAAVQGISLRANASLMWSRVAGVPGPDNRLEGQAPWTANLGADWPVKGLPLTVGASLNYTPGFRVQEIDDRFTRQGAKPVLDLNALWKFNPDASLRLTVSNASAHRYDSGSTILLADGSSEATDSRARTSTTVNLRGEFRF
ncbi:MAG: TonB-dependent receptor [Burkholderiaceae bacterium]|nr:TonB-dependent receptor [Burkholderiaceae bacterium]